MTFFRFHGLCDYREGATVNSPSHHRYYTNNTGLEAPFRTPALLVVPEVINFTVASYH